MGNSPLTYGCRIRAPQQVKIHKKIIFLLFGAGNYYMIGPYHK